MWKFIKKRHNDIQDPKNFELLDSLIKVKNTRKVEYLTNNFSYIDVGEAEVLVLAEERKCVAITNNLASLSKLKENSKTKV